MKENRGPLWTIDELGSKAAEALAFDYEGAPNDRIRDVPDRRTIRYYTTLGLIDRAAEMRGRTAYYGTRHLMQLAAIKRLQARGLSLAEVQRLMVGVTAKALGELARLPPGMDLGSREDAGPAARSRAEEPAFWKEAPDFTSAARGPGADARDEKVDCVPALQGIRLGEETSLLIAATRLVNEEESEAIRKAAAPLLKLLARRGLIGPRPGKGKGDR